MFIIVNIFISFINHRIIIRINHHNGNIFKQLCRLGRPENADYFLSVLTPLWHNTSVSNFYYQLFLYLRRYVESSPSLSIVLSKIVNIEVKYFP